MTKRFLLLPLFLVGCLGTQSGEAKRESKLANVEQNGPLPVTHVERDWTKAATGHGAVGAVPKEALDEMDQKSKPGASVKTEP